MVACSWQFFSMSRLAFITWASASLICPVVAQIISLACACISWRALEASSAKDKQSWPLWFSLMHLLQTIWSQALSNTWKGSLWSGQKLCTARGSKETTWWSLLSLLWAWKRAAPLHKSFLQFKQQKLAGCLSSQTSQIYELSFPFFWSVTFALIMSNNAKFFGSPATPAWGTLTSTHHFRWGTEFCYQQWENAPGSSYKSCDHNSVYEGKCFDHQKGGNRLNTPVLLQMPLSEKKKKRKTCWN